MPRSATLLLVRHAEESGNAGDVGLSVAGQARACAYAAFFRDRAAPARPLGTLIAATDQPDSHRPRLTLEPLAAAFNLPIDATLQETDIDGLVSRLNDGGRHDNATTLACWRHKQLPALVRALGGALPHDKWPDHEYGWLLQFEFDAQGALSSFAATSQRLMYGDGREPGEHGH